MHKLKSTLPIAFSIALLFLAVAVPILLCRLQDQALIGVVHSEPLSTAALPDEGRPLSAPEKVELLCEYGRIGNNIAVSERQSIKNKTGESVSYDIVMNKIVEELKNMQTRGAFPAIDLSDERKLWYAFTIRSYTDVDHPYRNATVWQASFSFRDIFAQVWMDVDTEKILQYSLSLGGQQVDCDAQAMFRAFSQYLGLNEEQEKLYVFIFQEQDSISLMLKALENR